MKVFRPELLLCALFGGVLGWCPRVFMPTDAALTTTMRWTLWTLALVWLVWAFREHVPAERPPSRVRFARGGVKLAIGLCVRLVTPAVDLLERGHQLR